MVDVLRFDANIPGGLWKDGHFQTRALFAGLAGRCSQAQEAHTLWLKARRFHGWVRSSGGKAWFAHLFCCKIPGLRLSTLLDLD